MIGSALASADCAFSPSAVGHPQVVAVAGLGHVGDAGGENALLAGELLVDEVGDAVRRQAQVGRGDGVALAAQVLAAHHVPQAKAHVAAAVGQAGHAAHRQRIGAPSGARGSRRAGWFRPAAAPAASIARNWPLRSRSAWTMAAIFCGAWASPRNGRDGDRQLGQAHAGHFDAELGERRQHAAAAPRPGPRSGVAATAQDIHVSWFLHHRFIQLTVRPTAEWLPATSGSTARTRRMRLHAAAARA